MRPALDLYKLGTRMFSADALEQLARYGTREELGWNELEGLFRDPERTSFPPHWELSHLLSAAVLHCVIDFGDASLRSSAGALRIALPHPDLAAALGDTRLRLFAFQIPLYLGDAELFERLCLALDSPEDVEWVARVDALRADALVSDGAAAFDAWWTALNEPFAESGVEPWEFESPAPTADATVFERIHAPAVAGCEIPPDQQPLVSVIVPAYCPDRSFVNTVESLSRQSWSNLEIIIVDDASPRGGEVIAEAAALDPRVQLITLERNSGAYHARNTGLIQATGEFVTVLDADDQAHPRRIERQIAPLLADPELMATASHAIRLYSDGSLITFGATALRRNASSLLFRRQAALDALGLYDRVYKAADTEYILRMQLRFGKRSVKHMRDALGLIQLTSGSLSRGDFRNGWWSGRRVAYRHQYFTWHQLELQSPDADFSVTVRAEGDEPGIHDDSGPRRFTAPRTFLKLPELDRLDLAFLADWSRQVEKPRGWAGMLSGLAAAGDDRADDAGAAEPGAADPIGLLHGVDQRVTAASRQFVLSRATWQLVESGRASWISWDQPVRIGTLVVASADYLVLLPSDACNDIVVDRLVVLSDDPPSGGESGRAWLDERCVRTFGVEPEWVRPSELAAALGAKRALEPTPDREV